MIRTFLRYFLALLVVLIVGVYVVSAFHTNYVCGPEHHLIRYKVEAIARAQKQNINVWTIYYPGAGHSSEAFFRVNNAQNNLSQLSQETGAESYYLGTLEPVSLKPYFDEIDTHLKNQYLLTFTGRGGKKGRLERVRAITEIPGVELLAPSEVFLPATQ